MGMLRFSLAVLIGIAASPAQDSPEKLPAMATGANPGFEVVTVKPAVCASSCGTFFTTRGRHIIADNVSVTDLISLAWGVHVKQIVDGPPWLASERFDIDGLPDAYGKPSHNQLRLMMQKLLTSRFHIVSHHEQRELPVYALLPGKGGPKLTKTERQPGDSTGFSYTNQIVLTVKNATMADFADGMQASFMDRPVVDQTGLTGRYDFLLKWTPDESQSTGPEPPGLYTSIEQQLGLKLTPARARVHVLVIDRIEKPSEN